MRGTFPRVRLSQTFLVCAAVTYVLTFAAARLDAQLLPPPAAPPPNLVAKFDPLLQQLLAANVVGQTQVIVQATSSITDDLLPMLIQQVGGTTGRALPLIDARAARLPNAALLTLATNAVVKRIALDRILLGSSDHTATAVGAAAVRQELGLTGAGVTVAVIDSGITPWHDDLADAQAPATQRVSRFVDFVDGQQQPYDDYGHGTHVAGIIAGNGADSDGAITGIAPDARLAVLKVLDANGRGRISDVIAALDYVVAHRVELNIRVVNLSIGAAVYESFDTDLLTRAAKHVVEQGIVVVAAAGNHGKTSDGRALHGAISAPGNAPWVITVGASSHNGTADRADDTMTAFSSRGPTAIDYAAKPDLVAPGLGIYSLSAPSSTLYQSRTQYLISGSQPSNEPPYLSLSGTSQAAPVVAGTVALMLQANPTLTPNAVKAILQYSAEAYDGHSTLAQGAGFLNARGAVQLAQQFGLAPAERTLDTTDWSAAVIWGNYRISEIELTAADAAWSLGGQWGGSLVSTGGESNVVWGTTCEGTDCDDRVWATSDDDTVVWGNSSEQDTVVWGNSDGDTVVWGNSDGDTVVWGNSASDAACHAVIWPES